MPLPSVPTPASEIPGSFIASALWNASLYNSIEFLTNPPAAAYQQVTTQSIVSGGAGTAAITWPTPVLDLYGGYVAGNPTRYTGQVAGYYLISGSVSYATNATGNRLAEIHKNGAGGAIVQGAVLACTTANSTTVAVTGLVFMNGTTDYIELFAYQNSGAPLGTTPSVTSLNIIWMHA